MNGMLRRVLAWCVLATPLAGGASTHAVLIGIDRYDNPEITALRYTVNDVKGFYDVLVDPSYGGASPDDVTLMLPEGERALRPTRAAILVQIKKAALRTQPDDTLILYFAGHGMETPEGQFLLGIDADPVLLADTAVPVERLPAILADVRASKILVIVDACRNDPAAGRAQADNPMGEAFERGLRPRILAPQGDQGARQVATWLACGVGQRAWEFTEHEHGVFSYFLLEGLKGGPAPGEPVALATLAEQVQNKVSEWAGRNGKEQTPRLENPDRLDLILTRPQVVKPGGVREIPLATLRVQSEPAGASVLVDNEVKGKTPLDLPVELADGRPREVMVRLVLEGYEPAAAGVTLEPGRTQAWSKTLRRQDLPTVSPETTLPAPDVTIKPPVRPEQPAGKDWPRSWTAGPDGLPLVTIEAGPAQLGTDRSDADMTERPAHTVSLDRYQIQAVEVTNDAFARAMTELLAAGLVTVDDDGNITTTAQPGPAGWPAGLLVMYTSSPASAIRFEGRGAAGRFSVAAGKGGYPVVSVTWFGAMIYAVKYGMRLPTEAEWERAAQAADPRAPYPWGTEAIRPRFANLSGSGDSALREAMDLPAGRSAAGCQNMLGNVWEWTADRFIPDYHRQAVGTNPYIGWRNGETVQMTLRGGGYRYPAEMTSRFTRNAAQAAEYGEDYGFRCVYPGPVPTVIFPTVAGRKSGVKDGAGGTAGGTAGTPADGAGGAYTFLDNSFSGARLAVPAGWMAQPQESGAVVMVEDEEDPVATLIYFYCNPTITTPQQVQQAIHLELQNLGIQVRPLGRSETKRLTGASGPFELFREPVAMELDGEAGRGLIDVVSSHGKFHGLVYLAYETAYEDLLADYQILLNQSIYP